MSGALEQRILEYRQQRDALGFFDLNCWFGAPLEPAFVTFEGVDALKKALNRYGIRRAIVSHTAGVRYDAEAGNRELLEVIRDDDSFFAAVTAVPEMSDGQSWSSVLRWWIANRVRIVRLFPAAHNFSLAAPPVAELLEAMQQACVPLMVWHTQIPWRDVAAVCSDFPRLKVIIEGTGRKLFYDNRTYYPLLEQFPNLFFETHGLSNYLGLDDAVAWFGSKRFLFGSYFPHLDPNSAIMPVVAGAFSDEDKRNIACGNLERLIAEVRQP
ncbi:MAG: amidohydrolase family protein [Verrucomicrobiae bacterium]|nr:amidohydrolase family protein [Verrucomicrobiae bacterium]